MTQRKKVELTLGDKSTIIVWYDRLGKILELYHELPMEPDGNGVRVASMLTNIGAMIPAIEARKSPVRDLGQAIHEAIFDQGW